jgi:hypothetical protein
VVRSIHLAVIATQRVNFTMTAAPIMISTVLLWVKPVEVRVLRVQGREITGFSP